MKNKSIRTTCGDKESASYALAANVCYLTHEEPCSDGAACNDGATSLDMSPKLLG